MRRGTLLSLFLGLALAAPAFPQPPQPTPPPPQVEEQKPAPPLEDKLSVTHHTVRIGGQEVRYTATAGILVLREEDGKPRASIFFVAYQRDGQDPARRPVTFTFNGGPGSSSVWLHMGTFGPRRVLMGEEGEAPAPPYQRVDNDQSLLDVTDLVFIDPVSTGFSRAAPGESEKQFHGVREDVRSVGELIRLWTARNGRWASPKFLAGESYGTTRAAALSYYLQDTYGMYLNGLVLVSSILDFQTTRFDTGNDLPYPLFLPTFTATAWYHKRLPEDLQAGGLQNALREAERFAQGEYALALMQGNDLPPAERRRIAERLAQLTGLSADWLERANLRITTELFTKELLRGQRQTVGRLDSRFKGVDRAAVEHEYEYDPSYAAIYGPFTAVLNDYVRRELGFESDLPYEILTDRVDPWSFADYSNRYVNVAEDMRQAMARNPALKVLVANGYYDLATPYFATEYTFDHLAFDPGFAERVTKTYYEAGHMMYIRKAELVRLKQDIAAFIRAAGGGGT
ncbi:MAG TPA: peptidase S10 [Thermoanaerobaculia bacterium]|nr:peptidase S10 [Thermoanaerobaculia bacterium]